MTHVTGPDNRVKISVITVCRNDLPGLAETWQSICLQDSVAFEWWVIDGNSNDGTVAWLTATHRFQGGWKSAPDNGIYDAMNKGIDSATGDYLLFMNSGDRFAGADTLALLIQAIEGAPTPPDFIYGDALDCDEQGKQYYRKASGVSKIRFGMITRHQAMLYRKICVAGEPYSSRFPLSADYALTASFLMQEGVKILRVDFPVCRFTMGGVHTVQRLKALREDFRIRKEILKESRLRCLVLFGIHWLHYHFRRLLPGLNRRLIYRKT